MLEERAEALAARLPEILPQAIDRAFFEWDEGDFEELREALAKVAKN